MNIQRRVMRMAMNGETKALVLEYPFPVTQRYLKDVWLQRRWLREYNSLQISKISQVLSSGKMIRLTLCHPRGLHLGPVGGVIKKQILVLHKNFLVNSCIALQSNQIAAGWPPVGNPPRGIPMWGRGMEDMISKVLFLSKNLQVQVRACLSANFQIL